MRIDRRRMIGGLSALAAAPAFGQARRIEGSVQVPGGRVWWMKVGEGGKPPLLLLHGGPGMGHDYLLPLASLADDRPVIFYDQLGCGRSDSPQDESLYVIPRAVDELAALRQALQLDRIVLFGHSWGSCLAIEYLCQGRGAGVEKLILAGAAASVPQFVAGMKRLIAALPDGTGTKLDALDRAGKIDTPDYKTLATVFYDRHFCRRQPLPPELALAIDNTGRSIAYRVMNGPNEFTVVGTIKDWDRRQNLDRIAIPTLLTAGQFDEVTPDCTQTLQRGIAGSTVEIFANCGHQTMNEEPQKYGARLRAFLER